MDSWIVGADQRPETGEEEHTALVGRLDLFDAAISERCRTLRSAVAALDQVTEHHRHHGAEVQISELNRPSERLLEEPSGTLAGRC